MKKALLPVLLITVSLFLSSFSTPGNNSLPVCSALNKALADVKNHYESFKGEFIDKNDDGSGNYTLKIAFDGFSSNQYVTSEEGGYLELFNEHTTKAKALTQYTTVAKQIEACLGIKGEAVKQEGLERLQIYKKNGSEIVLTVIVVSEEKSLFIMTIEKETEQE